jgi:glycosyltransferase involved in cell wall biosynthesis
VTAPASLCVLIPCHNEALSIRGVVADFRAVLPEARILVVNNASDDATAANAAAAGAQVLNEPRKGKAQAISTALATIDEDVVIMVDGDGSYPAPGALVLWTKYLEQPADLITGLRTAEKGADAFRPLHRFGAGIFARGTWLIFGHYPHDVFSGLRLFSRRFYKNVPILSSGFELEMELIVQAVDKGFVIAEAPVPFRERAEGTVSKLRTVRDGFTILRSLLILFRDYKPLFFFGVIALFFLLLGLLAGSLPIYEYYTTRMVGRFPLAILAAALVNISVFVYLTGLVAQANLRYHREAFQIRVRNFRNGA